MNATAATVKPDAASPLTDQDYTDLLDRYGLAPTDWTGPPDGAPISAARPAPVAQAEQAAPPEPGPQAPPADQAPPDPMEERYGPVPHDPDCDGNCGGHRCTAAEAWVNDLRQSIRDETKRIRDEQADNAKRQRTNRSRTLFDLPHGKPLPQLVPPFLGPNKDSATILYGPGGVGKGMLCVYFALRLVRLGYRVMVIDFEGHELEWSIRARDMGFTDDELRMVEYRAPFGDEWTTEKGTLQAVAATLREECDDLGINYIVIDSYVPATSSGDTMGGAPAAQEYFQGLVTIGRPSLTIAHVAGGGPRFPDKPFGSIFIHNLARETWAVEALDADDQEPWDFDTAQILPHVVALELRNKKMSNHRKSEPQFVSFSFFFDGHIEYDTSAPAGRNPKDLAFDILYRADKALSTKEITAAINSETGETFNGETIRKALQRDITRVTTTADVPKKWILRTAVTITHLTAVPDTSARAEDAA